MFYPITFDLSCVMFVSLETTTPADTVTPTLPADIESTTVPVTTTGETVQSVLHEKQKNTGLIVLLGSRNNRDESIWKGCMTLCRAAVNASLSEMTVISHAFVPFGSLSSSVLSFLAALPCCSSHLRSCRQRVWLRPGPVWVDARPQRSSPLVPAQPRWVSPISHSKLLHESPAAVWLAERLRGASGEPASIWRTGTCRGCFSSGWFYKQCSWQLRLASQSFIFVYQLVL